MSRPSRRQDQLLIESAKALLPETGVSAMSLKEIASRCGVNLGMFSYHFGNKDQFIKQVLESVYDDLFLEVEEISKKTGGRLQKFALLLSRLLFLFEIIEKFSPRFFRI